MKSAGTAANTRAKACDGSFFATGQVSIDFCSPAPDLVTICRNAATFALS